MMEKLLARLKKYRHGREGGTLLWLLVLGTTGLLSLFFLLVHMPLKQAAQEYRNEASAAAGEVVVIGNFQNAHLNRKEYQAELDKRQQRAMLAIPDKMDMSRFIVEIERLAQQSRLQLQLIRPQKGNDDMDIACLSLRLCLQGGYFSLLKFMQGLQNGERLVQVHNVTVRTEGQDLVTDLVVNIYAVSDK
ncbi:hypothetical protein SELR_20290 [Selenomonas ruminantium subsp. lactilytica TAM6421]|uniref:Pilus assembly protein, PilO n=1 Tax=Selenomonas ruminantium subsp. lactilytica (strain NBRC 103574 / TAM6421) TaxID=927704 RepID=I0GSK0_SELRL|nr:type 4a pilus biogenesis protein PilO [Selenomonas ruminantium]BAL83737.1 hypothetical protein SELR_20290 [Selenomonas ruminantium subsp. lactilytica TAM6421]